MVLLSVMCLFNCKGLPELSAESTIVSHGQKFSLLLHRSEQDISWSLLKESVPTFSGICLSKRGARRRRWAGSTNTRKVSPSSGRWRRFWSTNGSSAELDIRIKTWTLWGGGKKGVKVQTKLVSVAFLKVMLSTLHIINVMLHCGQKFKIQDRLARMILCRSPVQYWFGTWIAPLLYISSYS